MVGSVIEMGVATAMGLQLGRGPATALVPLVPHRPCVWLMGRSRRGRNGSSERDERRSGS
jgi:hypothetical protein